MYKQIKSNCCLISLCPLIKLSDHYSISLKMQSHDNNGNNPSGAPTIFPLLFYCDGTHTHTHTHPAFIGENNRCELLHGIAAKQTGENVVNRCVAMITTFHEQMVESATQTPSGGERNNRPLLHTHTCPIERNR